MLPSERRARISDRIRTARIVSTDELARSLDVSTETIRRDLLALERHGDVQRVHGGAQSAQLAPVGNEAPFSERVALANSGKVRIGVAAAKLVQPGQTVIIDIGTTALQVARALPYDFVGVVVTCSLLVAMELADRPHIEVLVSGGRLRSGDLALSNSQTTTFFDSIFADVAFLGSGGVDSEAGLTDYYLDEAVTRQSILRNSRMSFVLADSSKIGRIARHRVAGLEHLAGLITDVEPSAAISLALGNGELIIAD
ncbi:MAG: DeoR/GlpR family DNA-binding transcription regulator [Pseudolysinimonas sp.]